MELHKLNLSPREQKILESIGINSVERVATSTDDELSLGRKKGEAIIQRARGLLAFESIKNITTSDDTITVELLNTDKPILVSVRSVLGLLTADLKEEVQDSKLIIRKLEPGPCATCGKEAQFYCRRCGNFFCQECYIPDHYFSSRDVSEINREFDRTREIAQEFTTSASAKKRTSVDYDKVKEIAKERGFEGFANGLFAELQGNETLKKALTCSLFSIPQEPLHTLVIGDPAGGKTVSRDIIADRLGSLIERAGASATRAGLVMNMSTGEPGVLVYSNGKTVLADEFGVIPEDNIEYCYELLSNGITSIHSARVHETVESHFVLIAFANPEDYLFTKNPMDDIPLPPILLSRFAFVIRVEDLPSDKRKELFKSKLVSKKSSEELDPDTYLHWVELGKNHEPELTASEEAIDRYADGINKLVDKFLKTSLRRDVRMGDYAKRVPYAIARANLSDVDDSAFNKSLELIQKSLENWLPTVIKR